MTWLAPFAVAAVLVILYFFLGAKGANGRGRAMRRDLNFYFALVLATSIVSIFAGLNLDVNWVDIAAWVTAAVAIAAAIYRFKTSPDADLPPAEDRGPLEQASKRNRT